MAHDESTKFMGPTALAVRYNRCPDTIRRWSKLPGFPKAKGFGARPIYHIGAVDRFLSQIRKISVSKEHEAKVKNE